LQVQKPRSAPAARRPTPSTPSPPPDKASAAFHLDTVAIGRLDFSERLRILEGAEKPENAFWDSLRRVPLDTFQQRYIQQSDSLLQREDSASPSPKRRPSFSLGSEGLELSMRRGKGEATCSSELVGLWPGYTTLEGWVLQGKGAIQHARRGALWEGAFRVRYGTGWRRALPEAGFTYRRRRFPPLTGEFWAGWEAREGPDFTQVPLFWNTAFYLLRREAPLQVYDRFYVRARGSYRWHRSWYSALELTYDRRPTSPTRESYYPAYRVGSSSSGVQARSFIERPAVPFSCRPRAPFRLPCRPAMSLRAYPTATSGQAI
jgi:hypothetical protein